MIIFRLENNFNERRSGKKLNDYKKQRTFCLNLSRKVEIVMLTSGPILSADFQHAMAAVHAVNFQIYILERS